MKIDANIDVEKLEWLVQCGDNYWDFSDHNSEVICTGLMVRVVDKEPSYLPDSKWWKYAWQGRKYARITNYDAKCIYD